MRITTNLFAAVGAVLTMASCGQNRPASVPQVEILTNDSIAYCESVLADGDRLLVCNFGTDELNPLNTEGKGYVLEWKDGTFRTLIPADGNLSGPKGTLIKDAHLFIADVGKMVVYNLDTLSQAPQVVPFPEGELFVNDMALAGDTLYVTVTNTGNIYSLDVSAPSKLDPQALTLYTNVPGANGIVLRDDVMYVASYPPDGVTTDKNVIYEIGDIRMPHPAPLTDRAGHGPAGRRFLGQTVLAVRHLFRLYGPHRRHPRCRRLPGGGQPAALCPGCGGRRHDLCGHRRSHPRSQCLRQRQRRHGGLHRRSLPGHELLQPGGLEQREDPSPPASTFDRRAGRPAMQPTGTSQTKRAQLLGAAPFFLTYAFRQGCPAAGSRT